MALSRLQQIAIIQEASEATAATYANLFVAANAKYLVIDPSLDISVNTFERNIKRGSLTRLQSLTGTKTATARFSMELAGDTTAADAPVWGLPLRACGFRQERLVRLPIGALTGGNVIPHGTFITGGTSSATGMVVGSVWNGETSLYVAQENMLGHAPEATTVTEFSNGETVTAGSVTFTITGAPRGSSTALTRTAPAGYGWFPWSYSLGVLTTTAVALTSRDVGLTLYSWNGSANTGVIQIAGYKPTDTTISWGSASAGQIVFRRISGWPVAGDQLRTAPDAGGSLVATVGGTDATQFQIPTLSIGMAKDGVRQAMKAARGTVSFSGRIGEPMIMSFEFQGSVNTNAGAPYQDAGNIAGITYTSQIPPVLLDADLNQGKSSTITSGAEYGPCISQIDIAMANEIAFRECMADAAGIQETILASRAPTITIDPELVAEGSWDYLTQFYNNSTTRARFAVGGTLQNQFIMKMPGVSWTAETTGDRNGIATRQLQGVLHGGSQSSSSTAEDNELALIYRIL